MNDTRPRTGRRARSALVTVAALAVVGAAVAVYEMIGRAGNVDGASCAGAAERAARLEPLARGELAALMLAREPLRVPDIAFLDGTGAERRLSDWRGRTVLVNLWATWCAPCRHEMPALDNLQAELGDGGFEVVAVSIDTGDGEAPRRFLEEIGAERLAFYHDPSTAAFRDLKAAGRAFGMPTTLIVDPEGCEIAHLAGPAEWDSEEALSLVSAARDVGGTAGR